MFFAFILIIFGVFLFFRVLKKQSSKSALKNVTPKTEGEILNNPYIINHEKKLADDVIYEQYIDVGLKAKYLKKKKALMDIE